MSIGMLIPSVIGAISSFNTALSVGNVNIAKAFVAHKAYASVLQQESA
jgi:hypothetical protein